MKKLKRIAAAFTAVLMILSTVTAVNAVTVEKDGKKYTLKYKSPSTGDVNILMLRVGFADYDIDGEDYPADSEETLLSYFDGSDDSVNAYYERSSYGKLRLHCDRVFSYTAKNERNFYEKILVQVMKRQTKIPKMIQF